MTELSWIWTDIVQPSWISLLTAPLVIAGYLLAGRGHRIGWLSIAISYIGLVAIGLTAPQYGLIAIAALLLPVALYNWKPELLPVRINRGILLVRDLTAPVESPHHLVRSQVGATTALTRQLDHGDIALISECASGQTVATMWASLGALSRWAPPLGRPLHFGIWDAYFYAGYVLPEHRGQGRLTSLLLAAAAKARSHTMERAWAGCLESNKAGLKAFRYAGFEPAAKITAVTLFGHGIWLRAWPAGPQWQKAAQILGYSKKVNNERQDRD
jgi:GNAT superfamily N-acetyltransferase